MFLCFQASTIKWCAAGKLKTWNQMTNVSNISENICRQSRGGRRGSCMFQVEERSFRTFRPAGTPAALGQLFGTLWRESVGTASHTSWWEPSGHLVGNREHDKDVTQWREMIITTVYSGSHGFLGRNSGTTLCSHRVLPTGPVYWKMNHLIHCVPPPPPAHSLLLSTGSWTGRHRARSDVRGQRADNTGVKAVVIDQNVNVSQVLIKTKAEITMRDVLTDQFPNGMSRWRIPLLPGRCHQVWSSYTSPPVTIKTKALCQTCLRLCLRLWWSQELQKLLMIWINTWSQTHFVLLCCTYIFFPVE